KLRALFDFAQVVQYVVCIVRLISESVRIFGDLNDATKRVADALARFARLISDCHAWANIATGDHGRIGGRNLCSVGCRYRDYSAEPVVRARRPIAGWINRRSATCGLIGI